MLVVTPTDLRTTPIRYSVRGKAVGNTNSKYVREPDADLENALSFEEFKEGALNHIRELYAQKNNV